MTSVDQLGRQAGSALREAVIHDTDVDRGLAELRATFRRRRRTRITTSVLCAAAVVSAVVTWNGVRGPAGPSEPPVADRPPASACREHRSVTCPRPDQVRVAGPSSYEVTLPDGFQPLREAPRAPQLLDLYQRHHRAGVTVIQDAVGVGMRSPSVPAEDLAAWIASRPFLGTSGPRRTELDGRTAWLVEVRLAPGALRDHRDLCNGATPQCRALLASDADPNGWEVGPLRGMLARFYCVDAPGSRVTVIWSWAFDGDRLALDANAALVSTFTLSPSV